MVWEDKQGKYPLPESNARHGPPGGGIEKLIFVQRTPGDWMQGRLKLSLEELRSLEELEEDPEEKEERLKDLFRKRYPTWG